MRGFSAALAHGDYYRGNVRCVNRRIVALFDWDDACYWTLENELAWSLWEFAQADEAATLDLDRADRFLRTYSAHGGPVSLRDCSFIIPFIRDDIRTEIREAAAMAEAGLETECRIHRTVERGLRRTCLSHAVTALSDRRPSLRTPAWYCRLTSPIAAPA